MGIKVYFPGNKKVYADFNGFTVQTDQPVAGGGDGSAPSPYETFLASLATCAGIYVKGFCDSRGISAEGIELNQNLEFNPLTRSLSKIKIDINVPADFPTEYYDALVRSASQCAVKKVMQSPPEFEIQTIAK